MSYRDTVDFDSIRQDPLLVSAICAGIAVAILVLPITITIPGTLNVFFEVGILFLVYCILVIGLNLQYGFTGLVNFGHVLFFAVGAYTVGIMAAVDPFAGIGLALPWPIALLASIVIAAIVGGIIGVTTLRLRDDFLAIVTLAAAEIFHDLTASFSSITGGETGLLGIPQPIADAVSSNDKVMVTTFLILTAVVLVAYALVERLTSAPYGRVLRAIRADDLVTETLGKNVFRYKMQAFIYGAVLAGFVGGLYAMYNGSIAPGFFTLNVTVTIWIGMLLGGAANNRAVIVGLALIMSLRLMSRFLINVSPVTQDQFASLRLILIGFILVIIIRYRPEGIFGDPDELGVNQ
ncbi:branched-chain amino acid ABC transporter permease [Haladaptatus sp. NG-WS-4]